MRYVDETIRLWATDLAGHLGCHHLTQLSLRAVRGELERPFYNDPTLEVLRQKGIEHERAYLEHLRAKDLTVIEFPDHGGTTEVTLEAMREGLDVIFQAKLDQDRWGGRADFLLKTSGDSDLGASWRARPGPGRCCSCVSTPSSWVSCRDGGRTG